MSAFFTIFFSVFLAELGDKTQLATMLFASDSSTSPAIVFAAASAALVASTAIAVLLGAAAERYLAFLPLKLIAGFGFVAIGAYLVIEHFSKAA
jgi:putative Ca2+/H+ antiporter (TMEM165/GDT1 family)